MESKVNYTFLGIFVIALISALVGIAGWLISDTAYRQYALYYAYMNESVSGLNKEAPVKYNGVNVGYVADISLNPDNHRQVQLLLKIEAQIPITEGTSAMMISQGLTGLRFIELSMHDVHMPLLTAGNKKYPVIKTESSLLVRLDQSLETMVKDFHHISDSLKTLLDKETTTSLTNTLNHVEAITEGLATHSQQLTQTIADAHTVLGNSAKASNDFPQLVRLLQTTLKEMQGMTTQLWTTGADIAMAAKQSGLMVAQVNEQVVPNVSQLTMTLQQLGEQFGDLTQMLEKQPSMFVRGRLPAQPGPGEK